MSANSAKLPYCSFQGACCDEQPRPLPEWMKPERLRSWVLERAHVFGVHEWTDNSEAGVFARAVLALLLSEKEQPKDAPDVEAVANAEAPNRYQEYGLDVHKAFVGGAIFGSQYRAKQAKGDLTL